MLIWTFSLEFYADNPSFLDILLLLGAGIFLISMCSGFSYWYHWWQFHKWVDLQIQLLLFIQHCYSEDLGSNACSITFSHLLMRQGIVIFILNNVCYGLTVIDFISVIKIRQSVYFLDTCFIKSHRKNSHIHF